jgi:hypothetical protein
MTFFPASSEFTEGHELDRKWKVAKEMVGRRLSQTEAKKLLAKLECGQCQHRLLVGCTEAVMLALRSS